MQTFKSTELNSIIIENDDDDSWTNRHSNSKTDLEAMI